jgi:GH15 family glucan-1,4-alpha-glucosidase
MNYYKTDSIIQSLEDGTGHGDTSGPAQVPSPGAVQLSTPVELHGQDLTTVAEFTVHEGSTERFALSWFPSYERPGHTEDAHAALARTQAWWREWSQRCTYRGEYREEVLTSLARK